MDGKKFEIGDRVMVTDKIPTDYDGGCAPILWEAHKNALGKIGTIHFGPDSDDRYCVEFDDFNIQNCWWKSRDITHVGSTSEQPTTDCTNPDHYKQHPSGVECITITEGFNFNIGNAVKYLWRAGLKGDAVDDLRKAAWYVDREIERMSNEQ